MTFEEKEKYYKQHKHLFLMPSEKEIEDRGLPVVEVIKGLTLNVEEQSLEIIELYKKFEHLNKENEYLKQILYRIVLESGYNLFK